MSNPPTTDPHPPPKETWKKMQETHLKSDLVYKSVSVISSAVKKQGFTSSHIQVAVKKVDVTCEWVSNYLLGCRNCYTLLESYVYYVSDKHDQSYHLAAW